MRLGQKGARPAPWEDRELRQLGLLVLCASVVFSFATHGFLFANECFSHDSISYFTYATGTPSFYIGIGRFLIPLYEALKGAVAAPWLIGLLFTLWTAAGAFLTLHLLHIRQTLGVVLVCALFCTNRAATLTGATYIYCMDEYALALLLSVGAVWCFQKGGWRQLLAGLGLLAASLALYQAYFTVAIGLCFLVVLKHAAQGQSLIGTIREGMRYLGLLAAGFALYYGLWTALCALSRIGKRRVEESLLHGGLGRLSQLLWEANGDFVQALLRPDGVLSWLLAAVHILALAVLAARLACLLADRRLPMGNKVLLLLLSALAPTAFNAVFLLMNGGATGLMTFAWELWYLLLALCLEPWGGREAKGLRAAAAVVLVCVLWQHIVFANQCYIKKDLEKNATLVLAARVLERIEGTEGYVPGETPVAFVGRLDQNGFLNRGRDAFSDLTGTVGLWRDYAATYNFGRYLTDYLNYPLAWDTQTDFSQDPEAQAMPAFPQAGSVRMIDGTVVVKLS